MVNIVYSFFILDIFGLLNLVPSLSYLLCGIQDEGRLDCGISTNCQRHSASIGKRMKAGKVNSESDGPIKFNFTTLNCCFIEFQSPYFHNVIIKRLP